MATFARLPRVPLSLVTLLTIGLAVGCRPTANLAFAHSASKSETGATDATQSDIRLLLSPGEAVDLALFRGWLAPGGAAYVPHAREVWLADLDSLEALELLRGLAVPLVRPDLSGPSVPVFFVVARGPVMDRLKGDGEHLGEALALVVDRSGRARYVGVGPPWTAILPPNAQSTPVPEAPNLDDVSLARASTEMGGSGLAQPGWLPAQLSLGRIAIHRPHVGVDPTGATFDRISITYSYADRQGVSRMWLTQSTFLATMTIDAQPILDTVPPSSGSRYVVDLDEAQLAALAWQDGDRSFLLTIEVAEDLPAELTLSVARSLGAFRPSPPPPSPRSAPTGTVERQRD